MESVVGRGSCFSISLPRVEPAASMPIAAVPTRPAQRSRMVLVVDDDPAIRDAIKRLLEEWGHAVRTAASLDEALECAGSWPTIDLLLTDHRLAPGVTGIDTIDAVRAALGRDVNAAIITGDTSPTTLREIQARGLRLLHKPLDEKQLRELLTG